MDINTCFPSKYVGHTDLQGQDVPVTISGIGLENVSGDEDRNGQSKNNKPVIYFRGMTKGLILNKTNAGRIAEMFGPDTDHWIGQQITLYTAETEFGGKPVNCIRIRRAAQPPVAPPPAAPPPAPVPVTQVALPPAPVPAPVPAPQGAPTF